MPCQYRAKPAQLAKPRLKTVGLQTQNEGRQSAQQPKGNDPRMQTEVVLAWGLTRLEFRCGAEHAHQKRHD
eukprot:6192413-Pleurochrysis_carterae.AAC.7